MKVYKFGGASVKDAAGIKNVAEVLEKTGFDSLFMVVSAMGKTTNALEEVVSKYFENEDWKAKTDEVNEQHQIIVGELFGSGSETKNEVNQLFENLKSFLDRNKSPLYDFVYDQVVSFGELVSTKIVSNYLNSKGIKNNWLDVRDFIKTDDTYREGKVDWGETCKRFSALPKEGFYLTQGFLGSDPNYFTTTLGREGSDYTAAIIANCLDAESMAIWKDVPGVLNADPRYFENTQLLKQLSYEEAIELAYYGASVIHPKTMKPLRQKEIPFFVKSFLDPESPGTEIKKGIPLNPKVSCFILKRNQNLITMTTCDSSFISEDKISSIFDQLSKLNIKANLMQNSAITLSLCLEDKFGRLDEFLRGLESTYVIEIEKNVSLYTVRHFDENSAHEFNGKELLRQLIKNTLQIVVKE